MKWTQYGWYGLLAVCVVVIVFGGLNTYWALSQGAWNDNHVYDGEVVWQERLAADLPQINPNMVPWERMQKIGLEGKVVNESVYVEDWNNTQTPVEAEIEVVVEGLFGNVWIGNPTTQWVQIEGQPGKHEGYVRVAKTAQVSGGMQGRDLDSVYIEGEIQSPVQIQAQTVTIGRRAKLTADVVVEGDLVYVCPLARGLEYLNIKHAGEVRRRWSMCDMPWHSLL